MTSTIIFNFSMNIHEFCHYIMIDLNSNKKEIDQPIGIAWQTADTCLPF